MWSKQRVNRLHFFTMKVPTLLRHCNAYIPHDYSSSPACMLEYHHHEIQFLVDIIDTMIKKIPNLIERTVEKST